MQQPRTWQVRRTGVPVATGQQRWDRAYQLLLQWATTPPPTPVAATQPVIWPEMCHADSDLQPRLDRPSG
jgi:hypothetical protein